MGERLPLNHPEYQYPDSRNPYWGKLRELGVPSFLDQETERRRGSWRESMGFPPETKLHVEIGCNGGHVLLAWAERDPKTLYLGVESKFKQVHRGAEKAILKGLKNLGMLRAQGARLPFIFAPGEINELSLFFPDPWPKKSQRKNRIFQTPWLRAIAPLLADDGLFHIKTDHAGYFEWMQEKLEESRDVWRIESKSSDLHAGHPDPKSLEIPEVTLFEKLFVKDGLPIHEIRARRPLE